MTDLPKLTDFAAQTYDKLRYGDTDRQGHVNNAVFATFYETGRTESLDTANQPFIPVGFNFVVVKISIDYRAEIFWPGKVEIGTAIKSVGNSSVTFAQALFQNGKCVSTAEVVLVQIDSKAHRPAPLSAETKQFLTRLQLPA